MTGNRTRSWFRLLSSLRPVGTKAGGPLLLACLALVLAIAAGSTARGGSPQGQLTWGVHVTLAPTWFDPAETPGIITPFMVLYALHDALMKPMPGQPLAPTLAESWSASEDALTYEFVLRPGVKFHNGDTVTAEDVKFSFERYRGTSNKVLHDRVAAIETPDSRHIRFRLKAPWPDFLTFYLGATGAGWIVPKKYVEQVGEDGFKKAPIGAGPFRLVSFTPGIELVAEAFEGYWRKVPSVHRLVFKVMPDDTTRAAALKKGDVDVIFQVNGPVAEELRRTPNLRIVSRLTGNGVFWIDLPEQWDAKSPWHDRRVRLAASLALDRQAVNQAESLGTSRLTGSIVPRSFEFALPFDPPAYDPGKAKQLLAEAGYANGFDAGDFYPYPPLYAMGEALSSY